MAPLPAKRDNRCTAMVHEPLGAVPGYLNAGAMVCLRETERFVRVRVCIAASHPFPRAFTPLPGGCNTITCEGNPTLENEYWRSRRARAPKLLPVDSQSAYSGTEGVRVDFQQHGRAVRPFDPPLRDSQGRFDVLPHRGVQGYNLS